MTQIDHEVEERKEPKSKEGGLRTFRIRLHFPMASLFEEQSVVTLAIRHLDQGNFISWLVLSQLHIRMQAF